MAQDSNTDNFLAIVSTFTLDNPEDIAKEIAADFRKRRVEKGLTREEIAAKAEVAPSNVARFEQKGLISFSNLISLAIALGYLAEVKNIFHEPKYDTMEELRKIRKNRGKKRAYRRNPNSDNK